MVQIYLWLKKTLWSNNRTLRPACGLKRNPWYRGYLYWLWYLSPLQKLTPCTPIKIAIPKKIESARGTMGRRKTAPFLFLSPQPPYDTKRPLRRRKLWYGCPSIGKITLPPFPHLRRGIGPGMRGEGPGMRSVYINPWDQRIISVN